MAVFSVVLEVCLDVYKLVPVDLYETGMKVVIEDARLIKELAMRKKAKNNDFSFFKAIDQEEEKKYEELFMEEVKQNF